MIKFKRNSITTRSVMVFILSVFILALPVFGQPLGLNLDWQNSNEAQAETVNPSQTEATKNKPLQSERKYKLEPIDQIIIEADILSRSSRGLSSSSLKPENIPAGREIEPDLEHDIIFDIVNSGDFDPQNYAKPFVKKDAVQFVEVEYLLYISANKLNLRSGPTLFANIISELEFGDKVECLAESDDWVKISFAEMTGYVSKEYTSREMVFKEVKETMYVSANSLNLRTEPDASSDIIAELNKNYTLTRTGIGDGWSRVKTASGKTGYVVSEHLTSVPPIEYSDPKPVQAMTDVSAEEIALFTKIVAMEGSSRYGYDGYLAVATVILNRVDSSRFPNTITRVVSQPGQFSVYTSTRKPSYNDNVRKAVKDALEGKRNLPGYVLFFAMPYAYENNVESGGVFARLNVYKTAYGHVWCYYPADYK